MYVDRSLNPQGAGAGIILDEPRNILIRQFLQFSFKTSNNQVEYEAIIVSLQLFNDVGVSRLLC